MACLLCKVLVSKYSQDSTQEAVVQPAHAPMAAGGVNMQMHRVIDIAGGACAGVLVLAMFALAIAEAVAPLVRAAFH
jgi:hypothetical protein